MLAAPQHRGVPRAVGCRSIHSTVRNRGCNLVKRRLAAGPPPHDKTQVFFVVPLPPSSRPARLLRLPVVCPASSGDGSSIVGRGRRPPRASSHRFLGGRCRLLRLRRPRVCPALVCASFCFVITGVPPHLSPLLVCSVHRVDSFSREHQPEARPASEPLPKVEGASSVSPTSLNRVGRALGVGEK